MRGRQNSYFQLGLTLRLRDGLRGEVPCGVVAGRLLGAHLCSGVHRAHLVDSLVVVNRLHGVCEAFPGSPEIHWELVLQVSAVGAAHAVVHGDVLL